MAEAEAEEIRMPDEPGRLMAHSSVDVTLTLRTSHAREARASGASSGGTAPRGARGAATPHKQNEEKPLLAGRCTTHYVRPNGVIIEVRPQLVAGRPAPVKRPDLVHVRLRRSQNETLEADGVVSWVRPKAFLPSGQAVSFIGVTFDGDPDERALELAAFLARPSAPPVE
jgi:hypothetical protein